MVEDDRVDAALDMTGEVQVTRAFMRINLMPSWGPGEPVVLKCRHCGNKMGIILAAETVKLKFVSCFVCRRLFFEPFYVCAENKAYFKEWKRNYEAGLPNVKGAEPEYVKAEVHDAPA